MRWDVFAWAAVALLLFAAEALAPGAFMLWLGLAAAVVFVVVLLFSGIPVLGHSEEVRAVVDELNPDVVFFTAGAVSSSTALRRLAWDLEDHAHVQIIVAPNVTDVSSERVRIRPVAGLPLMHLGRSRSQLATNDAKRAFDVVGSLVILAVLWPLLLALMLWIKLYDGGPALFRQTRIGMRRRPFEMLKFRTMAHDAPDAPHRDLVLALVRGCAVEEPERDAEAPRQIYKLADDARITRAGRWLRKTSLDELPQLFNVLRGEMSLVGPRPLVVDEDELVMGWDRRRLHLTPGMTGPWQILGGGRVPLGEMVKIDYLYVTGWSLWNDVKILLRTASYVLARRSV